MFKWRTNEIVMLDYLCIQIFHNEIDILICTSTLQHIQEQEATTLNFQPLSLINQDLTSL